MRGPDKPQTSQAASFSGKSHHQRKEQLTSAADHIDDMR
jgi:hypothetical protein